MGKYKLLAIIIAVISISALTSGLFLFFSGTEDISLDKLIVSGETSAGLGITYLPVTRGISEYYGLGVEYGALVTEVSPDSPADQAGLRKGDVILSFNGMKSKDAASLLEMMMACPVGDRVTLEVWKGNDISTMELFHLEK